MVAILRLLATFVPTRSSRDVGLKPRILCLRHQLNIALRQRLARPTARGSDRALLVWMTRRWPGCTV